MMARSPLRAGHTVAAEIGLRGSKCLLMGRLSGSDFRSNMLIDTLCRGSVWYAVAQEDMTEKVTLTYSGLMAVLKLLLF